MYEIPNIPLKLPLVENLGKMPEYPYTYATQGVILGSKFEELINLIIGYEFEESILYIDLMAMFEGHHLEDLILDLELQGVTDFCRHITYANKDGLGWDLVDLINNDLNNITIPGWRLPNFDFVRHFENLLSGIVKVYFPDRLISEIKNILTSGKIDEIGLEKDVKSLLHLWTIQELWLLLSYLAQVKKNNELSIDQESHTQLTNIVCNTFEDLISSGNYNIDQQICLTILYIDAYSGLSQQTTKRSKELLDRIWNDIRDMPYQEKLSYKYLLGVAYSLVGSLIFEQNTDFVSRKLFVDSIIDNFVETEDYHLEQWFTHLLDQDMNELIMDLIIRGYSKTVPLLYQHAIELPESHTRDLVVENLVNLNSMIKRVLYNFLSDNEELSKKKVTLIMQQINSTYKFDKVKENLIELVYTTATYDIFLEYQISDLNREKFYQLAYHLFSQALPVQRLMIYDLDYHLNTDNYDYDLIYSQIEKEVKEFHSIILSPLFEQEIIAKSNYILSSFSGLSTASNLFLQVYEVLLEYLMNWLNYFKKNRIHYHESLLVISPFIHICLVQHIQYYYENNFPKKAFLANLNLHSFMEIYSDEVDRYLTMDVEKLENIKRKKVGDRFKEITSQWSVREILPPDRIKKMVLETKDILKNSGFKAASHSGRLLEDDIIHGYLTEVEKIERFLTRQYRTGHEAFLADKLTRSDFYHHYDPYSLARLERIGVIHGEDPEEFPTPLFKNIHRISVALGMFELRTTVEEVVTDQDLITERFEEKRKATSQLAE